MMTSVQVNGPIGDKLYCPGDEITDVISQTHDTVDPT